MFACLRFIFAFLPHVGGQFVHPLHRSRGVFQFSSAYVIRSVQKALDGSFKTL
jgi:hypothetical protein